jgi:catechol 2,3-dioxygenase-like lactoylglutathione lyase family enzyme
MKDYLNGLQHIGIPTQSVSDTIAFYKELGFEVIMETKLDDTDVAFLDLNGLVIETYTSPDPAMKTGAINHIAIDVSDIDECLKIAKERGYIIDDGGGVNELSFWNGVRYFTIEGINKERIEFSQKL